MGECSEMRGREGVKEDMERKVHEMQRKKNTRLVSMASARFSGLFGVDTTRRTLGHGVAIGRDDCIRIRLWSRSNVINSYFLFCSTCSRCFLDDSSCQHLKRPANGFHEEKRRGSRGAT